jgi:hypothetical protein
MELRGQASPEAIVGQNGEGEASHFKGSVFDQTRGAHPRLTTSEWKVVAAAFGVASTHACGRTRKASRASSGLRRLLDAFTSLRTPQPRADPQIEKLRAFLCFARDHGQPSHGIGEELLELGFNKAQVEALALLALQGTPPHA